MKIHRYITIFIFFTLSQNQSFAQAVPHLNFWSRASFTLPFNKKWKTEVEFQHRRQNDYALQSWLLFKENLLSSVRTWVHFQQRKDVGFSVSPFAYYWNNPIIIAESDKQKPKVKEIRYSFALDVKHELEKNLWLINRSCFEYRDFQETNTDFIRFRNRLGLRYEFNSKWNLSFLYEVFLTLNESKPSKVFDHDRLAMLLNFIPTKNIRIETGYMYITRMLKNTDEFLYENNFLVHLYFMLPYSRNHNDSKY